MIKKVIFNYNILKNLSWTFLAKIVAMIFALAIDILAARVLGVENYAEWTFFYTVVTMIFYVTWLGVNASVKVYVSRQNTVLDRNTCIHAGLVLRTIISLFFAGLFFFLSGKIAVICGYPEKYPNLFVLFRYGSLLIFFNSYTEFFKELNIGIQRYKNMFWITLSEFGGNFVLGFAGVYLLQNVTGMALGYVLSGIIVLLVGLRGLKSIQYNHSQVNCTYNELIKEIFRYAVPLAVISIGGMVLTEMDTFMLGVISTKKEVSMYSIAKQLCSKAAHINYALATGTLTSFSLINSGNKKEKREKLKKLSNINLLITGFVVMAFIIAGSFLIELCYGKSYQPAGKIMIWLVPYYVLYSISTFFSLFLDFQGKAGMRSICYCSVLLINFVLNWILIPVYGAVGASIATGVSLIPYVLLVIAATIKILT